jgi:DNA polymerase-1
MLYSDPPARISTPGTFQFAPAVNAKYTIGHDFVKDALAELFRETTSIGADIETYGLGLAGRRLKSVSFGSGTQAVVLDPRDPFQRDLIIKGHAHVDELIYHNSPFDLPNLYMNSLVSLDDVRKVTDTLIYCRLANPGERVRKNLEDACDRYLQTGPGGQLYKAFKALGLNKTDGFLQFDLDRPIYAQGAASDPIMTWRLHQVVKRAAYDRLTTGHPFGSQGVTGNEAWELVERENRINRMITLPRSCKGFRVDFDYLDQYTEQNAAELADAEQSLAELSIRPGNGQDLAKALESIGAIDPTHPRTKTGLLQMDAKAVEKLSHPVAAKFKRHKEISHIRKDYLAKVAELADDNGLVHPTINLLTAATGRVAMGEPPLQQFSGSARGILLADVGDDMTSIDLSQGEPLTIANAAGDMDVIAGYEAGTSDLYTQLGVGSGMLPPGTTTLDCEMDPVKKKIRGVLKTTLLAQLYGEGLAKLTADLGLDDGPWEYPSDWEVQKRGFNPELKYPQYAAAKQYRKAVFRAMPKTEEFIIKLKAIARQHRMMLTIAGRVLDVPWSPKYKRVEEHKGVNYFCQGGQYDLIADALLRVIDAGLQDAVYLTLHDEFVVSTSTAPDIRKILETPSARFCFWSKRTPILRTDMKNLGERWAAA